MPFGYTDFSGIMNNPPAPSAKIDKTQFACRIREGLPVLSPHAEQILRACEDPSIDFTTLAARLGESPTIAARLLGLANSSFFGLGHQVNSLAQAIQVLGLVTVRGIAVGLVIADQFFPTRCRAFAPTRFWQAAMLTAQLVQQLAPRIPPDRQLPQEAAYMAGLLHNIGLLALVTLYPREMDEVLADHAAAPLYPLGQRLRDRLGIDHHQAAGWLGEAWRLPTTQRLVMEHHHEPDYRGECQALVVLTGVCARCASSLIGMAENDTVAPESEAAVLTALGLDTAHVADCLASARVSLAALQSTADTFIRN